MRYFIEFKSKRTGIDPLRPERMSARERMATPTPFRDLLIAIARSARVPL